MNRNDANGAEQNRSRLEHIAPAPVSFLRRPKPFDREAAMRAYEKEGKIGRLHNYFYSTVGTGTTVRVTFPAAKGGK